MTDRRRLPTTRTSVTHKFQLGGPEHKGYVTVGLYEDRSPGEVFIRMAKTGSTIAGLLDSLAIVVSMALQHGVPLDSICTKLAYQQFEPAGHTGPEFKFASSVVDYVARWLQARFVNPAEKPCVKEIMEYEERTLP